MAHTEANSGVRANTSCHSLSSHLHWMALDMSALYRLALQVWLC